MIHLKTNPLKLAGKFAIILYFILSICYMDQANAAVNHHRLQAVDSTSLKNFEGIYQMKDNAYMVFKITVSGNNLLAKNINSDQQITLTRKSDLNFEMPDDDGDETMPVVFSKNETGAITQVTVAGRQIWLKIKNYVPVKEVTLTATQLKSFEGKFELEQKKGTFLQITATATGLTLKQLWNDKEINFVAISDDTFLNKQAGFPLTFTKDANGNIVKVLAFNRDMWDKVKE